MRSLGNGCKILVAILQLCEYFKIDVGSFALPSCLVYNTSLIYRKILKKSLVSSVQIMKPLKRGEQNNIKCMDTPHISVLDTKVLNKISHGFSKAWST